MRIHNFHETRSFLTAPEVPTNLLRLKPGDRVLFQGPPRKVVRVGYRLTSKDFEAEAQRLLDLPAAREAHYNLAQALGVSRLDVAHAAARALAGKAQLGGPERGVWTGPCRWADGATMTVLSTRCVRLGTYYPGSGGWSHGPDGSEYEYEYGGLSSPRTVVLVRLAEGPEVISGDLVRAPRINPSDAKERL